MSHFSISLIKQSAVITAPVANPISRQATINLKSNICISFISCTNIHILLNTQI